MNDEIQNVPCPQGLLLGPKRALLVLFAYFAAQGVVGVVVGVVTGVWYAFSRGGASAQVLAEAQAAVVIPASLAGLLAGGTAAFCLTRRTLPGRIGSGALTLIGWSRANSRDLLLAAVAGVGLAFFYLFGLVAALPPTSTVQWGPLTTAAMSGGWPRHGWAFLALIVAPPIEEFVFRGVLFAGLSRSWMPGSAAALVLALFVLTHYPEVIAYGPAAIGVALLGGATLVARIVTKSLLPAIVVHSSYNLGLVVAIYAGTA